MTDAALPVTERAVERIVESYLASLGADIRKKGRRWTVSLPDEADTDLELDDATLVVTTDPDEVEEGELALAPEGAFVERLIDEAAERHPVGSLELTGETVEVQFPAWLTKSSVEIVNHSFTPYYDREALCVLFHIGIETVSEYQAEELRAVAIDTNVNEQLPELAETYVRLAEEGGESLEIGAELGTQAVDTLDVAREAVETDIAPFVENVRKRATRAATVELEEYREYARQRLNELNGDLDRLAERIKETTETVKGTTDQSERIEALRERKALRHETEALREERDDLRAEVEADFPERRREVRNRHALTVRMRPVALAAVTFERGEIALSLSDAMSQLERSFAYAVGIGIRDDQHCERCGTVLSESNPLAIDHQDLVGTDCCQ